MNGQRVVIGLRIGSSRQTMNSDVVRIETSIPRGRKTAMGWTRAGGACACDDRKRPASHENCAHTPV